MLLQLINFPTQQVARMQPVDFAPRRQQVQAGGSFPALWAGERSSLRKTACRRMSTSGRMSPPPCPAQRAGRGRAGQGGAGERSTAQQVVQAGSDLRSQPSITSLC